MINLINNINDFKIYGVREVKTVMKNSIQRIIRRANLNINGTVKRSEDRLPIGNGVAGTLVWTSYFALKMQVSRVDVYASDSSSNSLMSSIWITDMPEVSWISILRIFQGMCLIQTHVSILIYTRSMATSKEMREKPLFRLRRGRRAGFSNSG
jgi:hypothetical protein